MDWGNASLRQTFPNKIGKSNIISYNPYYYGDKETGLPPDSGGFRREDGSGEGADGHAQDRKDDRHAPASRISPIVRRPLGVGMLHRPRPHRQGDRRG